MNPVSTVSKSAKTYLGLRELITRGHFAGGERLTEAKVAQILRVKRGSVRESILKLEAEGLLSKLGGRKSRVVVPTVEEDAPDQVLARYELREHIEGAAARLAAKNMNGWQIDHLRELAQEMTECEESGNHERRYDVSAEFHHYLVANCGNAYVFQVWETQRLAPVRPKSLDHEREIIGHIPPEVRNKPSNVDIVEAIAAHDQDEAEQCIRFRIRTITEALRKAQWARSASSTAMTTA